MNSELLILGGSSTALEILEAVNAGYKGVFTNITFVIGDSESPSVNFSTITDSEVVNYVKDKNVNYIISFTNHKLRLKLVDAMENAGARPCNIIHPLALISPTAKIGKGNYIAAGVKISVNSIIANHCIINFNCIIGHDAIIENHVMINPGVSVSGNVYIAQNVFIGTNSIVFQGKKIGEDVIIDAMTYITRDIESNMICSSSRNLKVFRRIG